MSDPVDLSKLSDEDLQIYEDLLKQKQSSQHGATGSWDAPPPAKDKPWVSPTNPLYPLAEGVHEGVRQLSNVGQGAVQSVTGLPGAVVDAAKTGYQMLSPDTRVQAAKHALDMAKGVIQPAVTIGREAGALVAPGSVDAPSQQEQDDASRGTGMLAGGILLPEAANGASDLASPENLQNLAARARMVRDAGPNNVHGAVGAAAGGAIGYKVAGAPGAVAGGAVGGAIGRNGVGAMAGGAASVLDKLAQIRLKMGAAPATPLYGGAVASEDPFQAGVDQSRQALANRPPDVPAYGGAVASEDPFQAGVDQSRQALANRPAQAPPPAPVEQAVPPEVQKVRDSLIRRGKGAASADLATTNAQYLLKIMPEAAGLSDVPDASGVAPFDRALTDKLNATGHEINAKLQQDVPSKKVDTTDASLNMEEIANKASGYGDHATANKIRKLAAALDQSGMTDAQIVTQIRQSLMDSSLDISSGLGNEVYKIFKDLSEKISPGIKDLNQKYFTLKTAAEIGKIRTGGPTPESQVGAGTRPGADFRDSQKARVDAAKKARAK